MKYLFWLFIVCSSLSLYSQNGGESVFHFLNIPSSAQSLMNGGALPVHNSATIGQAWENPAELSHLHNKQLQLNYTFYFADAAYTSAIFAYSLKNAGNVALGIRHLGYGDFDQADEFGIKNGSFTAQDNVIDLFWSKSLLDSMFQIGVGISNILSNYEQYSSFALSGNIGLRYQSSDKLFSAGLVLKNAGRQLKTFTPDNYESLPFSVQLGISKKLAHAPFRFQIILQDLHNWNLDYTSQADYKETKDNSLTQEVAKHFNFGIEFAPSEKFKVGVSYNHKRRQEMTLQSSTGLTGFAWGVSIRIKRFNIQFANSFAHKAAASQMFSVSYSFQELSKK